jgi:hypothetical protein
MIGVPSVFRHQLNATIIVGLAVWLAIATTIIQHHANVSSHVSFGDDAAPFLGILVDHNLRVLAVDSMGAAARAGIQPGDVLRKIAGFPLPAAVSIDPQSAEVPTAVPALVRTSNEVKAAFHAAVPAWEDAVTIVLERSGKILALRVLVTAKAFHYDPANPPPSVTAVPSSMDATAFYL